MRAYTSNDLQAIVNVAFKQGFEIARVLHHDAPMPEPPTVQEIVDHPYHSSDAPGQVKNPWLNDKRGQRGLVKEVSHAAQEESEGQKHEG